MNEITPFLDGGLIYGTTKAWSDVLRLDENNEQVPYGLLAYSHDGRFPAQNTIRLPMFNPPPPSRHSVYVERGYLEPVTRYFSKNHQSHNNHVIKSIYFTKH
uniref:Uncharacterized protein n=1 Tax=Bracon brevicornis TaxID=1563983 RepID=A0A6V7KIU4_9HYME